MKDKLLQLYGPYRTVATEDLIKIARIDHWFKNLFMVLGILFAYFHNPDAVQANQLITLVLAVLSTCLVASSNYVLNEIQDAEFDKVHPQKKYRPIASNRVNTTVAYIEYILLAVTGLFLAATVNRPVFITIVAFSFSAIFYNVKPFRFKDIPYLDVITESANNPLRLLLGWFVFVPNQFPSISLLLSYWMIGAFFMATKRFAEIRSLKDKKIAGRYRKSFRHYTEARLMTSIAFYITGFSFFLGVFVLKYHFELILSLPFIAGFVALYLRLGFKQDSVVQNPEKLYTRGWFVGYVAICLIIFIILLLTSIPDLYLFFNVQPIKVSPLWVI